MRRFVLLLAILGLVSSGSVANQDANRKPSSAQVSDGSRRNIEGGRLSYRIQSLISITDSGWTTSSSTSDCATGQGDDTWQLTLSQSQNVTITVTDCCCPGDYYEVRVDGNLVGTTPNLAPPWGCSFSGPLSSGSFTVMLCPGSHSIAVRDAGFDGHSLSEIQSQSMCPAGFTVSGSLSAPLAALASSIKTKSVKAQSPSDSEAQRLQEQVDAVSPFVVTGEDGLQRLAARRARRAGLSTDALDLGHKLVALNNRIVTAANRDEEAALSSSEFEFIEPLFRYWAQFGVPDSLYRIASHCGDRDHPTPCPPRIPSGQFFSTENEARQHLTSLGYHRTAFYASLGGYGSDFTLLVSDAACGLGPFRSQAIIFQQGPCWTYNTQGPEPNPEFLTYIWPHIWWVGYVRWWHFTFC